MSRYIGDNVMSPQFIPKTSSTGMTEDGGYSCQRGLAASSQKAASALCTFINPKTRHPGKGDPLFRIARKPGPGDLLDLPWNGAVCFNAVCHPFLLSAPSTAKINNWRGWKTSGRKCDALEIPAGFHLKTSLSENFLHNNQSSRNFPEPYH